MSRPARVDGPSPTSGKPAALAADPRLRELESAPGLLVRSPELAEAYCRRFVAGGSWDTVPAYSMRVRGERQLVVVQTPWVLDDIEALMNSWKPTR